MPTSGRAHSTWWRINTSACTIEPVQALAVSPSRLTFRDPAGGERTVVLETDPSKQRYYATYQQARDALKNISVGRMQMLMAALDRAARLVVAASNLPKDPPHAT